MPLNGFIDIISIIKALTNQLQHGINIVKSDQDKQRNATRFAVSRINESNCKLMCPDIIFNDKSAILMHPGAH